MSVQGKNTLSYKKKNVQESNVPSVGIKAIAFAHEFTSAGEDFLPFNSLNLPTDWASSGLTNPSGASLLAAQLQLFKRNITVVSSDRNTIQKSEYIVKNNGISFKNITSLENEVFEVTVGDVLVIGTSLLDMRKIRVEGELADTTTDFAFGYQVDVFDEEIVVVRDGQIQHRSDDNDSSGTTGNYYYLDGDNDGKASSIRFFNAAIGDESILVFSTGGIVDSPNISTFQQIETLAGQLDNIIPTVAALAGVDESEFRAAPNYADLKNFGQRMIELENKEVDSIVTESFTGTTTVIGTNISSITTLKNNMNILASSPTINSGKVVVDILQDCTFTMHASVSATNNASTVSILVNGISRGSANDIVSTLDPSSGGGSFVEDLTAGDVVTLSLRNQDSTGNNFFSYNATQITKVKIKDLP